MIFKNYYTISTTS